MKSSHKIFSYIVLLLVLMMSGCRISQSDQNTNQEFKILILLSNNISPADLEEIKSIKVDKMNKTSRTENLWLVSFMSNSQNVTVLLDKLRERSEVEEVEILKEIDNN